MPLPTDRVIDGVDWSPILFNTTGPRGHVCLFYYHNAVASNASEELYAARCERYKVYWATKSSVNQPWPDGKQDPPLIFDMDLDPGESVPLASNSSTYRAALLLASQAKEAHLKTITPVPDQNGRGSIARYVICSDPNSVFVLPNYPPYVSGREKRVGTGKRARGDAQCHLSQWQTNPQVHPEPRELSPG